MFICFFLYYFGLPLPSLFFIRNNRMNYGLCPEAQSTQKKDINGKGKFALSLYVLQQILRWDSLEVSQTLENFISQSVALRCSFLCGFVWFCFLCKK